MVPGLNSNESSNSLDVSGVASYTPLSNLQTSGFFERRTQEFLGEDYAVSSYGASATYAHPLLDGRFNSAVTVTANASDNTGEDTLGVSANENYSSLVLGWHVTESFGYAQNAQTLLVTYMNSFYNYSGNVRRNWGLFNVSMGVGGARTALTQQAGTANSSQSYNASVGYGAGSQSPVATPKQADRRWQRGRAWYQCPCLPHTAFKPGEPFRLEPVTPVGFPVLPSRSSSSPLRIPDRTAILPAA